MDDTPRIALIILLVALAALLLLVLLGWLALRRVSGEGRKLMKRIARLPWRAKWSLARDLMSDPGLPLWARAIPPVLVVYLATPIDLVPDFVPVLGQLDDIIVLVIGIGLLLRVVPRQRLLDAVDRAERGLIVLPDTTEDAR